MMNIFKKYWVILLIGLIIIGVVYYFGFSSKKDIAETLVISPAEFTQTVSVSGKVTAAKSVELGFNKSGRITSVPVIVGQQVGAGQLIAQIDSSDAYLALQSAQIELKKMIENSNLTSSNNLSKDDENSLAGVDKAYIDMATIFDGLNLILNNYQVSTYKGDLSDNLDEVSALGSAQNTYYKARKAYDAALVGYRTLKRPLSKSEISTLTENTYNLAQGLSQAVNETNTFVTLVYNQTDTSTRSADLVADKSKVADWRVTTNSMISTLSSSRNTLKDSTLDIEGQKLIVQQKENDYANYFLRAPFAGIITRLDIKTGEQAIAGQATVSMINSGLFEIESFVPEINIANLKVGNPAEVTLDAYGKDVLFTAKIISIDPAETIHDGVSTYKVKLQFDKEDARIKPGMTANLFITSLKKENVISVPAGSIINRNDQKFVQVLTSNKVTEKLVTTGATGLLGQTEILTGLNAGDNVILTPKAE